MTVADPAQPLLDAAHAWHAAGYCVIPSHEDGSKRPFAKWKEYQTTRPEWPTLEQWLLTGRYTGIGCIMGQASGNAEMIEIEGPDLHVKLGTLYDYAEKLDNDDLGAIDLVSRAYNGCSEWSGGNGLHIFVKVTDGPVPGNQRLASTDNKVITETRGEGGFVIVWPTPARHGHDDGAVYMLLPDTSPANTAQVTSEELELLHYVFGQAFGGLNDTTPTPTPRNTTPPQPTTTSLSPLDDYRQRTTWRDILEPAGWTHHSQDNEHNYWTRPGKPTGEGHSASTIEDGPFYLFSTSVPNIPHQVGLSKGDIYAHLYHQGDLSTASRTLRSAGYGDATHTPDLAEFITTQTPTDTEIERTSWWPRDLTAVLSGHENEPDPTYLQRDDGPAMFYAGRVNGLIGESESGKTWVALHAASQELNQNRPVIYLDFEDSASGIINRLRTIGCTDTNLNNLTYISPDETLSATAKRDLGETLGNSDALLVILDGFNAAMTLMGLDINSNNDATHFAQQLLKPIAATGACVIYVDHVPKSREARGKGGIGAQAKRAMTTGCALTVTVTEPFGEGQAGRLHLTVDKDRPGRVRAKSYAAKHAGDVILTPHGTNLRIHVQPSDKNTDMPAVELAAQRELINIIRENPGINQTQIEKKATGGNERLRGRLDHLVHLAKVQVINGPRSAKQYHFIEELDALSPFELADDD